MPNDQGAPPIADTRPKLITVYLTTDEYNLLNWSRLNAGQLSWGDFATQGMIELARRIIRDKGHKLPQGIAEINERLWSEH